MNETNTARSDADGQGAAGRFTHARGHDAAGRRAAGRVSFRRGAAVVEHDHFAEATTADAIDPAGF